MTHEDQQRLNSLLDALAQEAEISSETTPVAEATNAVIFNAFRAAYAAMVATTHELVSLDGEDFLARIAAFVDGCTSHDCEIRFRMGQPRKMTIEFVAQFRSETRRMTVAEQTILAFDPNDFDSPSTSH